MPNRGWLVIRPFLISTMIKPRLLTGYTLRMEIPNPLFTNTKQKMDSD